jgi:hypothetical protein
MASNIRLFIGTPVHSEVSVHYFKYCLEFKKECFVRNIHCMFQVMKSSLVTQGRNLCVSGFLDSECTHMLFIDSDIAYNFKMIERMLNYDKEITLIPYPVKTWDDNKVKKNILKGTELDARLLGNQYTLSVPDPNNVQIENGFIELERGPTGCMLIRRDVFDKLGKEYPEFTIKQKTLIDGDLVDRTNFFNYFDTYWDKNTKTYMGEDFFFCKLAKHAGIKMYGLIDEYIEHYGEFAYRGRLLDELKIDKTNTTILPNLLKS